jgi:hypothetical protein
MNQGSVDILLVHWFTRCKALWPDRGLQHTDLGFLYRILSWNIPHGLFRILEASAPRPVSPAETNTSNMSDIEMLSSSDRDVASVSNSTSKLAVALSQKRAVQRAHLFLQGKFPDLLTSMNVEEKRSALLSIRYP